MSIADEISRILQAKADIKIAIEGKGVTVSGSATLDDYDDYIDQIQQGSTPNLQTKSVTPTESAQVITADTGYDGLEEVDVAAISSSYVGSGITRRSSTDLSASGDTVTVPAGYYSSQATKAVSAGTAGTPTATKGTVSNHSISVTPSVTNTSGYIASSTKTGTAVTVSASELVSGSETKTSNGTYDVTNLASLVVNVSGGGGGSSYTLLASKEFTVSTTSTSNITVGTIDAGSSAYTSSKLLYVCIRDKAGPRAGHFYGSDNFIQNHNQIIGSTGTISTLGRNCISVPSSGINYTINSSGYGVYAYSVKNTGTITIYARYSSSTTYTIDGTFKCDVYLLEWPNNVSPFVPLSQ